MDFTTKPLPTAPANKARDYTKDPVPTVPVEMNFPLVIWEWIAHQAVTNGLTVEKWMERHFKGQMLALPIPRTSEKPTKK